MKLFLIMLISIFLGMNGHDKLTVTQEGNVTTIQIGDKIYKSAYSEIGEAWTDKRNGDSK
jgi:hypothetical protein